MGGPSQISFLQVSCQVMIVKRPSDNTHLFAVDKIPGNRSVPIVQRDFKFFSGFCFQFFAIANALAVKRHSLRLPRSLFLRLSFREHETILLRLQSKIPTNRRIQIFLFSNRIEVTSPGRIPNTLTIEKIKTGNSALRNHTIVKYLDNLRYIDALGRGVPMIVREMGEKVTFREEGELFKVIVSYGKDIHL
jgi:hypothetical protein